MPQLTRHFRLEEFTSHDGAALFPGASREYRRLCLLYLEPLRDRFGEVAVISGHRSVAHNRAVGGVTGSYHLYVAGRHGVAADVRCAEGNPHEWRRFLEPLQPGGLGVYTTHVHVDTRHGKARW